MANTTNTVRLSIEVPIEVNEQLATFLHWGTKAEAIRALVELLIRTQLQNKYIVNDLLAGRCSLVVQNLNTTRQCAQGECDD